MQCWHKWSNWEQYNKPKDIWVRAGEGKYLSKPQKYTETRQRRNCVKCNYAQDEIVVPAWGD